MTRDPPVPGALAALLLALLAAPFLLGMITKLYAPIPPSVPGLHGNLDARLRAVRSQARVLKC